MIQKKPKKNKQPKEQTKRNNIRKKRRKGKKHWRNQTPKHNRKTVGKRHAWDVTNMLKSRNCTQKKHTTYKKKTKTQSQ